MYFYYAIRNEEIQDVGSFHGNMLQLWIYVHKYGSNNFNWIYSSSQAFLSVTSLKRVYEILKWDSRMNLIVMRKDANQQNISMAQNKNVYVLAELTQYFDHLLLISFKKWG